jgi:hypothetical protein
MGCGPRSCARAKPLAARYITHSKFNRAGFDEYLFDGNKDNISRAGSFFKSKKDCLLYPPVLTCSWITVENVNELLIRSGCAGEVDLFLSI